MRLLRRELGGGGVADGVFAVEDGKAVVKRVKVGAEAGSYVVIEQGLVGNEQIVIQGLQNLRPGVPVLASPVTPPVGRS